VRLESGVNVLLEVVDHSMITHTVSVVTCIVLSTTVLYVIIGDARQSLLKMKIDENRCCGTRLFLVVLFWMRSHSTLHLQLQLLTEGKERPKMTCKTR
jgi:hypothetical protein